jgi:PilZ domain-containing protein
MSSFRPRRSCRLALSFPIRILGTDFEGIPFTEETITVVVSLHGAKIRSGQPLHVGQEIRLLSLTTHLKATYRVVSQVGVGAHGFTFWGLESLEPGRNLWGVKFPELRVGDQASVRLLLECPECFRREFIYTDEPLLESLHTRKGVMRRCLNCKTSTFWTPVPPRAYGRRLLAPLLRCWRRLRPFSFSRLGKAARGSLFAVAEYFRQDPS